MVRSLVAFLIRFTCKPNWGVIRGGLKNLPNVKNSLAVNSPKDCMKMRKVVPSLVVVDG